LVYTAREKVKGVAHHAKAGNINSCLLKEGHGRGHEFMMVLDCDMIVHPDFLLRTLGHFYEPAEPGSEWLPWHGMAVSHVRLCCACSALLLMQRPWWRSSLLATHQAPALLSQ
jgi:cellulose synthase/poly-beta-1,6-N-acetylglucosamine synthase-like glycosyltransferase